MSAQNVPSPAATLVTEDFVKNKIVGDKSKNMMAPQNPDCCFGNFPPESRPKRKHLEVAKLAALNSSEQSTAQARSKYTKAFESLP